MARKLTKKQKAFADKYLETDHGQDSVLETYDTTDPNTARAIASENLTKPNIVQYLEENASGAISRIVEMSRNAKNEAVKLSANKDIADRAGYKPVERSISLTVEAEITNPEARQLAKEFEEKLKTNI